MPMVDPILMLNSLSMGDPMPMHANSITYKAIALDAGP